MFTRCIKNKTIINPRVFSNALPFRALFIHAIIIYCRSHTVKQYHPATTLWFLDFFFFFWLYLLLLLLLSSSYFRSVNKKKQKKKQEEKLVPFSLMSLFPCSILDWVDKECNFALPLRGCRKKGKQSRAFPSFLFQVSSPVKFRNNCVCCSFS